MITLIVLLLGTRDTTPSSGFNLKPDLVTINVIGGNFGFGSYSPQDIGQVLCAPILDSKFVWGKKAGFIFGLMPVQVVYSQGYILVQIDESGTVRDERFSNITWELASFKLGFALMDKPHESWWSRCLFKGQNNPTKFNPRLDITTCVIPISVHSRFYDSPTFLVIQNSVCASPGSMFSLSLEHKWRPFYTPSPEFWEANLFNHSFTLFLCLKLELDWIL